MEAALCTGRTKRDHKLLLSKAPFFSAPSPGQRLWQMLPTARPLCKWPATAPSSLPGRCLSYAPS